MDTALPRTAFTTPLAMFVMLYVSAAASPLVEHEKKEQSPEDQPDQPTIHHRIASL
jgi:hypothetical protein